MPRRLFRVYIDESGDRGWGEDSSDVFVVSAVIIPDENDAALRAVLDTINAKLGRPAATPLHWAENIKNHAQRKYVVGALAGTDAIFTNTVMVKRSLQGMPTSLKDSTYQYNYAIRRLLERISWYVDEAGGEAIVTFAHIRRFKYRKLLSYIGTLRAMESGTEIRWPAIRTWRIAQPNTIRLLQMADMVAGAIGAAVRADEFGDHEPSYLIALVPRLYIRGGGKVTSYGFNVIGAKDCMNVYPWWRAFMKACAERG